MLNMLTRAFAPQEIVLKKGALLRLRFITAKKALVICGRQSAKEGGGLESIAKHLGVAQCEMQVYSGVSGDPSFERVQDCIATIRAQQPDVIIAIGGGAVLDTAKLARAFLNEEHINWSGPVPAPTAAGPQLIAVPTTAGSGAEVSIAAVVTDTAAGQKIPLVSAHLLPDMVLLDPTLTLGLPVDLTVTSALDAFTHAFEAYGSRMQNAYSSQLALSAGKMIVEALPSVIAAPDDLVGRESLLYAAMLAGQAQNMASVGAVHALSHALGATLTVPHGLANAIFLPYVAALNATHSERTLGFLKHVGFESVSDLSAWIQACLEKVNLPSQWSKAIASDKAIDMDEIAQKAKADVCIRTNPKPISLDELTQLLEEAA